MKILSVLILYIALCSVAECAQQPTKKEIAALNTCNSAAKLFSQSLPSDLFYSVKCLYVCLFRRIFESLM